MKIFQSRFLPFAWSVLFIAGSGLIYTLIAFTDSRVPLTVFGVFVALSILYILLTPKPKHGVDGHLSKEELRGNLMIKAASTLTTVLVFCLLATVNFIAIKFPKSFDFTKSQKHSLTDQSIKAISNLSGEVKLMLFGKPNHWEASKLLLANYKSHGKKVETEFVDVNKSAQRARAANVRAENTLVISYQGRQIPVESPDESKITNELIKLSQTVSKVLCYTEQHGERLLSESNEQGLSSAKDLFEKQGHTWQSINLQTAASVPASCALVAVFGPTRSFFDGEMKSLKAYLEKGGALYLTLDPDAKGVERNGEWIKLLSDYGIKVGNGLILDPLSKPAGLPPEYPLALSYNASQAIVKDLKEPTPFAVTRPLDVMPSATLKDWRADWLVKSSPSAWAETDFKSIATGVVKLDGSDLKGPLTMAVVSENSTTKSRIVVIGSTSFQANGLFPFGRTQDVFGNALAWLMRDDSQITLRKSDDKEPKLEIPAAQFTALIFFGVIVLPILLFILAGVIWWRRKRI